MNWEDEQFVKVYTRDTGEWTLLSWDAQALLLQILRKVDRSGVLQLGKHGARVLPAALGHREQADRIAAALQELTADGCVVLREGCLVVPNFIAAQTTRQSDKARQQSARDRRRAETLSSGLPAYKKTSQNVTDSHLASPGVTTGHPASPRVTLDEIREDEKRQDKKPSGTGTADDAKQLGMPLGDEGSETDPPKAKDPEPVQTEKHLAIQVFAYLLAARKRCKPSARTVEPTETHLKEITRCLREGIDAKDLLHVVDVWEAQVKSGRQEMAHFDSVTPFRASNVGKYLQMGLDDASKPRGSMQPMQGYGRNPKPESDLEKLGRHFRERREARERGDVIEVESAHMLEERRDDD